MRNSGPDPRPPLSFHGAGAAYISDNLGFVLVQVPCKAESVSAAPILIPIPLPPLLFQSLEKGTRAGVHCHQPRRGILFVSGSGDCVRRVGARRSAWLSPGLGWLSWHSPPSPGLSYGGAQFTQGLHGV